MSNEIVSASPRTSTALEEALLGAFMVRNVSRRVCSWKVPGVSPVGITLKDSRGDTASEVAERRPILSQERYLGCALATGCNCR